MAADTLVVTSPTGVDVELAIAGPGSRAYAFLIDWHIRILLVLTWYIAAAEMLFGGITIKIAPTAKTGAIAFIPIAVLYLLYHPLLELAMRGQTPGKRMAGVQVVNRLGGTPSSMAVLIRNAFRLIDALPAFYGVGLIMTIFTAHRVRLGDLAAGTLLVHNGDPEAKALSQLGALSLNASLDPGTVALGSDLLLRWKELAPKRRQELARELLRRIDSAEGSTRNTSQLAALDDRALHAALRAALFGHQP